MVVQGQESEPVGGQGGDQPRQPQDNERLNTPDLPIHFNQPYPLQPAFNWQPGGIMEDNQQMNRTESTLSDVTGRPMSEDEYRVLEQQLVEQGHTSSQLDSLNRFVENNAEPQNWPVVVPEGGVLMRADTLENNPIMVNPQTLTTNVQQAQIIHSESGTPYAIFDVTPPQPLKPEPAADESSIDFDAWGNLNEQYQLTNTMVTAPTPAPAGATSCSPCTIKWPGKYEFSAKFSRLSENTKNKNWDFSADMNKLFIDIGKDVMVSFNVSANPPDGLYIRALPVYAVASHFKDPVVRCPNHSSHVEPTNAGDFWPRRHHVIRFNHGEAVYEEDQNSKRLSVRVPVERPQGGSRNFDIPMKFMCLSSDVGGINRRPLKVIFTLENPESPDPVLGRHAVDVRICSCPKRDRAQEEKRAASKEKEARQLADGLGKRTSTLVFTQPSDSSSSKKRKIDKDLLDEMIMVPVAKCDYEKINEQCEALVIARNLAKVNEIKAVRRRLLEKHNPTVFTRVKRENTN